MLAAAGDSLPAAGPLATPGGSTGRAGAAEEARHAGTARKANAAIANGSRRRMVLDDPRSYPTQTEAARYARRTLDSYAACPAAGGGRARPVERSRAGGEEPSSGARRAKRAASRDVRAHAVERSPKGGARHSSRLTRRASPCRRAEPEGRSETHLPATFRDGELEGSSTPLDVSFYPGPSNGASPEARRRETQGDPGDFNLT